MNACGIAPAQSRLTRVKGQPPHPADTAPDWRGGFVMQQSMPAQRAAVVEQTAHVVPVRRWHPTGHQISIFSSLLVAIAIGIFFIGMRGFTPQAEWQEQADFTVTWVLLTYIWIQMGTLILVGAGTKTQMWLDALTSIVPMFVIAYVLLQYYGGYIEFSQFQAKTAWVTAYTMLLDLVIDLGVSVLLSRQVVDVGAAGVG
jgi:hypothetical protein